jgi:hypothetical protein
LEAKEAHIKEHYDKKLKKFEKLLLESQAAYQNKQLVIQGSLDEARREYTSLKIAFDAKETTLREELNLKDRQLISQQSRIDALSRVKQESDSWKRLASDVAGLAIRACATAVTLPDFRLPPDESIAALLTGFQRTIYEHTNEDYKLFKRSMDEYERFKRCTMALDRKRLVKLLRFCKKVVDLARSHNAAAFDEDHTI